MKEPIKQQQDQQLQQSEPATQFPSLNIGFDLVRERLVNQSERVNTLDTKASFVLGSSTLIIGAAILTRSQIPSCTTFSSITFLNIQHWPIAIIVSRIIPLILMLSYVLGVIFAFLAYRIRGLYNVPNPRTIYESYLIKEEDDTKKANFRAMVEAYERNQKQIDIKTRWTNGALLSLFILAILLALPLLYQVVC